MLRSQVINEINYNLLKKDKKNVPQVPIKPRSLSKKYLKSKTIDFGVLIKNLYKLRPKRMDIRDFEFYIKLGLIIAQNWRNQDIHTPTNLFNIDIVQYINIKDSYQYLYKIFFPKEKNKKIPKITFSNDNKSANIG